MALALEIKALNEAPDALKRGAAGVEPRGERDGVSPPQPSRGDYELSWVPAGRAPAENEFSAF